MNQGWMEKCVDLLLLLVGERLGGVAGTGALLALLVIGLLGAFSRALAVDFSLISPGHILCDDLYTADGAGEGSESEEERSGEMCG